MPLLVINLGGEMIYILQQRLQAQNVAKSRARKVLQDVLRTMYSKTFVGELFKPQEMYSNSSTRQIFNKLAHSSIMRINEASMEKLYDLMTMGVKYQLLCCNAPTQIMQVTLNHLYAMKQISTDSDVDELITNVFNLVKSAYCSLRNGDWELLKQQLFQFFQGRKVKVSLFLQANLQHMNGTLVLLHSGPVAYGSEVPGDITYYDSNGEFSKKVEFEALHGSGSCEPACSTFFDPKFYLGLNIYLNDKKEMKEELEKYWEEDDYVRDVSEMMMDAKDGQLKSGDFSASPKARTKKDTSSSVAQSKSVDSLGCDDEVRRKRSVSRPRRGSVNELNMLASLMGAAVEKTENENEDNGGESKVRGVVCFTDCSVVDDLSICRLFFVAGSFLALTLTPIRRMNINLLR